MAEVDLKSQIRPKDLFFWKFFLERNWGKTAVFTLIPTHTMYSLILVSVEVGQVKFSLGFWSLANTI
jgi:hypothetical protein